MEAASIQRPEQDLGLVTGGLLALVRKKTIDTLLYEHTNKIMSASFFGVVYFSRAFCVLQQRAYRAGPNQCRVLPPPPPSPVGNLNRPPPKLFVDIFLHMLNYINAFAHLEPQFMYASQCSSLHVQYDI